MQIKYIINQHDVRTASKEKSELKPCPFCGRTPLTMGEKALNGNLIYHVFCTPCVVTLSVCLDPAKTFDDARFLAVQRWNTRQEV